MIPITDRSADVATRWRGWHSHLFNRGHARLSISN